MNENKPSWLVRLEQEHAELADKIEKLMSFLEDVTTNEHLMDNVSQIQFTLMKAQLVSMMSYSQILSIRINEA